MFRCAVASSKSLIICLIASSIGCEVWLKPEQAVSKVIQHDKHSNFMTIRFRGFPKEAHRVLPSIDDRHKIEETTEFFGEYDLVFRERLLGKRRGTEAAPAVPVQGNELRRARSVPLVESR